MNDEVQTGNLTGFRCPECGGCLYANLANVIWCSNCSYNNKNDNRFDKKFYFVDIPDEQVCTSLELRRYV